MFDLQTIAKYLGLYGAGVVTAGFFLSGPVERPPPEGQPQSSWVLVPPALPFVGALPNPAGFPAAAQPAEPFRPTTASEPPARPAIETTGSARAATQASPVAAEQPAPAAREAEPSCNRAVCRSFYSSFDEATCTYKPYGGGPRQLCTR